MIIGDVQSPQLPIVFFLSRAQDSDCGRGLVAFSDHQWFRGRMAVTNETSERFGVGSSGMVADR